MGEFLGDDAGSPVFAKLHVSGQQIAKYQPGSAPAVDFDRGAPLEATVERRPLPFMIGKQRIGLDLAAADGPPLAQDDPRIGGTEVPAALQDRSARSHSGIGCPTICAHPEALQQFTRRTRDARWTVRILYFHLKESDGQPGLGRRGTGLTGGEKAAADAAGKPFDEWFEKL
jgi:hypothetical protein